MRLGLDDLSNNRVSCPQGSFNINPYYCRRMRVDNIQICKLECSLSIHMRASSVESLT